MEHEHEGFSHGHDPVVRHGVDHTGSKPVIGEGNLYAVRFRASHSEGRIIGRVQVAAVSKPDALDMAREWALSLGLDSPLRKATASLQDVYVRKYTNRDDPFLVRYPTSGEVR